MEIFTEIAGQGHTMEEPGAEAPSGEVMMPPGWKLPGAAAVPLPPAPCMEGDTPPEAPPVGASAVLPATLPGLFATAPGLVDNAPGLLDEAPGPLTGDCDDAGDGLPVAAAGSSAEPAGLPAGLPAVVSPEVGAPPMLPSGMGAPDVDSPEVGAPLMPLSGVGVPGVGAPEADGPEVGA